MGQAAKSSKGWRKPLLTRVRTVIILTTGTKSCCQRAANHSRANKFNCFHFACYIMHNLILCHVIQVSQVQLELFRFNSQNWKPIPNKYILNFIIPTIGSFDVSGFDFIVLRFII